LRDIYYTNRYDPGGVGSHAVDPEFPFELGEGEFFAMGDNSSNSKDSRYFGPVHRDFVMGNAVMVMPWFFNTRCKLVK